MIQNVDVHFAYCHFDIYCFIEKRRKTMSLLGRGYQASAIVAQP